MEVELAVYGMLPFTWSIIGLHARSVDLVTAGCWPLFRVLDSLWSGECKLKWVNYSTETGLILS